MKRDDLTEVFLWGRRVGALLWDEDRSLATFEYDPEFPASGLEPAPLTMPTGPGTFTFPELAHTSFSGLPGLVFDSLPDKFGTAVVDHWLRRRGRDPERVNPVERLGMVGTRGMGALEYAPSRHGIDDARPIDLEALVRLSRFIVEELEGNPLAGEDLPPEEVMDQLVRMGTSAGGARAKVLVAWNPKTDELRSGQSAAPRGFEPWLLKLDGVESRDRELRDPLGFGRIEYAYSLMARAAGIEMSDCRLLERGGLAHFMTRRFDRGPDGSKLHMQSLCALAHLSFDRPGAHSYEEALELMQRLRLPSPELAEMYRRLVFNVILRDQDDHTKNIHFLMDESGRWRLSPAFDVTFAYNPTGTFTGRHQMSLAGKRDDFTRDDLLSIARRFRIPRAKAILAEVSAAALRWEEFAGEADVGVSNTVEIGKAHRLELAGE